MHCTPGELPAVTMTLSFWPLSSTNTDPSQDKNILLNGTSVVLYNIVLINVAAEHSNY